MDAVIRKQDTSEHSSSKNSRRNPFKPDKSHLLQIKFILFGISGGFYFSSRYPSWLKNGWILTNFLIVLVNLIFGNLGYLMTPSTKHFKDVAFALALLNATIIFIFLLPALTYYFRNEIEEALTVNEEMYFWNIPKESAEIEGYEKKGILLIILQSFFCALYMYLRPLKIIFADDLDAINNADYYLHPHAMLGQVQTLSQYIIIFFVEFIPMTVQMLLSILFPANIFFIGNEFCKGFSKLQIFLKYISKKTDQNIEQIYENIIHSKTPLESESHAIDAIEYNRHQLMSKVETAIQVHQRLYRIMSNIQTYIELNFSILLAAIAVEQCLFIYILVVIGKLKMKKMIDRPTEKSNVFSKLEAVKLIFWGGQKIEFAFPIKNDFCEGLKIRSYLFGNEGLKNVRLKADPAVQSGDILRLECDYDLESAQLYSIKWYFGHDEFYRYVPKESPPTRVFPLPGVVVDLTKSDHRVVNLENVQRNLTGYYACEVSADAPLFHTDVKKALIIVVESPRDSPRIYAKKKNFSQNGKIEASCVSTKSYPATNLTWYINGRRAQNDTFKKITNLIELELGSLETSKSKLEITSPSMGGVFVDGKLKLLCQATLFSIYNGTNEIEIVDDTPQLAHVLSPTPSHAKCTSVSNFVILWSTILLCRSR